MSIQPSTWQDTLEFLKGVVRPFIIISSWSTLLVMWLSGIDPPLELKIIAGALTTEYFGERAKKRLKE